MLKTFTKFLDILQLDHAYQQFTTRIKGQTRSLTEEERALGESVFGKNINYQTIRIDEQSITARRLRAKYVSFNTINSWGKMSPDVFIHELVHIWQYQRLGSIYIAEALAAQRSEAGYNYGGVAALRVALEEGKTLRDFNFEQQGDIVQDYYLLTQGYRVQWGTARQTDATVYAEIIERGLNGI